jgi:hypothetical protein
MVGDATVYSSTGQVVYYIGSVILGLGAGPLWTAQGQLCMAYPTAEKKGLYFGIFWALFNVGPIFGGLVQFISNYHNTSGSSNDASYIAFGIVMAIGIVIAAVFVANPSTVTRNDGSKVQTQENVRFSDEIKNTFGLFTNPAMLLMTPLFLYSNWFYAYQGFFTGSVYSTRTKGIAGSTIGYGFQVLGALVIGKFLDGHGLSAKKRAMIGLIFMVVFNALLWGLTLYAQTSLDVGAVENMGVDIVDDSFGTWFPKIMLNMLFGLSDSVNQVYAYWVMGQLSDDIGELGRFAGYYKFVQNIGGTIAGFMGTWGVGPEAQIFINIAVCACGLIGNYFAAKSYVVERTFDEENPKDVRTSRGSSFSSNVPGMYDAVAHE